MAAGAHRRGCMACKACGGELRGVANRDGRPFRARGQDAQGTHRSEPASLGGQAKRDSPASPAVPQSPDLCPALRGAAYGFTRPPGRYRRDFRRGAGSTRSSACPGRTGGTGAGCHPRDDRPARPVLRDGRRIDVAAAEIVPGDVVLLEAGDRVPADLRLVRVRNLRIDEAILTGESVPVDKSLAPVAADAPLGDRLRWRFRAPWSPAARARRGGRHRSHTEIGRISASIGPVETLTTPCSADGAASPASSRWSSSRVSAAVFLFAVLVRGYPGDDRSWRWSASRWRRSPKGCRR